MIFCVAVVTTFVSECPAVFRRSYGHKDVLKSRRYVVAEEASPRLIEQANACHSRPLGAPCTPLDPATVAQLYQQRVLDEDVADRLKRSVSADARRTTKTSHWCSARLSNHSTMTLADSQLLDRCCSGWDST
jgi:hypothetical protein